jgi:hypothetical protein
LDGEESALLPPGHYLSISLSQGKQLRGCYRISCSCGFRRTHKVKANHLYITLLLLAKSEKVRHLFQATNRERGWPSNQKRVTECSHLHPRKSQRSKRLLNLAIISPILWFMTVSLTCTLSLFVSYPVFISTCPYRHSCTYRIFNKTVLLYLRNSLKLKQNRTISTSTLD